MSTYDRVVTVLLWVLFWWWMVDPLIRIGKPVIVPRPIQVAANMAMVAIIFGLTLGVDQRSFGHWVALVFLGVEFAAKPFAPVVRLRRVERDGPVFLRDEMVHVAFFGLIIWLVIFFGTVFSW